MIAGSLTRLRGSALIALNLRGKLGVPFLPREEIDRLRDGRVRATVAYAARHVPYYRELFARGGIDPRAIRGASDLDRLPVLDKELVRARPELFVAETPAARTGLAFTTSGTTGTPVSIRHDRRSMLLNLVYGERERDPVNRGCGGQFRPKELYVGYETSTFKKVQAFYASNTMMPVKPRRAFVSLTQPIDEIAAVANVEKPDVLVSYGGWIDVFYRTVVARGLQVHRPKMVVYMGEALPHGAREHVEGTLGIPVLSRYNAVESFKIGYFCEERTGFHLHEDICHVRIVRPDGTTAAPGEQGRIVISNLLNRASVLLNYPIGDVGALRSEPCPCGRTFVVLGELEGRVEDVIALPDGSFVHPRTVWGVFKGDADVLQYQLVQTEPRRFSLTLVTVDGGAFDRAVARALPPLRRLLAEPQIEAMRCSEIDRGAGGKFRAVAALGDVRPSLS